MTASQGRYYGILWRAACSAQGWDPKDDARRHSVTRRGSNGRSDSAAALRGSGLTDLFNYLKLLANDTSIARALPVVDRKISSDQEDSRQLIYAIQQYGYTDFYVYKVASAACAAARVTDWRQLPPHQLQKLRFTIKDRAMERDAKARLRPPVARVKERYHRRPKPTPAFPEESPQPLSPRAALQKAMAAQASNNPF